MSIIYTFECNKCGNKIVTREQECKHESILEEAGWIQEYGSHTCRECRPTKIQGCTNECGNTTEYFTTGKETKREQLIDDGWIESDGEWFCGDECQRDHLFGRIK